MAIATTVWPQGVWVADQEPYTQDRRDSGRRKDDAECRLGATELLHIQGQQQEHPVGRRDTECSQEQQDHRSKPGPTPRRFFPTCCSCHPRPPLATFFECPQRW